MKGRLAAFLAGVLLVSAAARCGRGESGRGDNSAAAPAGHESVGAPVLAGTAVTAGVEPLPASAVHLAENHSDALVRWAMAGVRNRILVHVDGHIDFDWLPPETIEAVSRAVAARDEAALRALEAHPWDLTAKANSGFGIWNFIYPAARAGLVREEVWVVPEGTLADEAAFEKLRRAYAGTLSGVTVEEIEGLRFADGVVRGTLCGVPFVICERARLPRFEEPVLLDVDLDWFTTRSAVDQTVLLAPRPPVDELVGSLRAAGLRTELVTVSYSTVGGYLPYEARSVAADLLLALLEPERFRAGGAEAGRRKRRDEALRALEDGRAADAVRLLTAASGEAPDNAPLSAALGAALRAAGRTAEADGEEARARQIDPACSLLELYRGDVDKQSDRSESALDHFQRFLANRKPEASLDSGSTTDGGSPAARGSREPDPVPDLYAMRRVAFCQLGMGRMEEAANGFRRLLALRPEHADTRFNLADALAGTGDLPGAIEAQREACRLRPFDARYAWKLGAYLLAARDPRSAEAPLRRGVEGRPASPGARYNLAMCLAQLGRFDEALTEAEAAVRLDPATPGFRKLVEMIRAAKERKSP